MDWEIQIFEALSKHADKEITPWLELTEGPLKGTWVRRFGSLYAFVQENYGRWIWTIQGTPTGKPLASSMHPAKITELVVALGCADAIGNAMKELEVSY